MRKAMFIAWALVGATLAVGAAEKEVLRVEYEYARPGEPYEAWVQTYFADQNGRLVRISRIVAEESQKAMGLVKQSSFVWADAQVTWKGDLWNGRAAHIDEGIISDCGGVVQTYKLKAVPGRFLWTTEAYTGEWTSEGQLDLRLIMDEVAPAVPTIGITAQGSRLSTWVSGFEEYRILLDRRPKQLNCTFVAPSLDDSGWYTCGKIVVTGPGFGRLAPEILAMDFVILDSCGGPPVWQNFLLNEKYLR